jgi:hypothetical protein
MPTMNTGAVDGWPYSRPERSSNHAASNTSSNWST